MLKEKSKAVFNYVVAHSDEDITAEDIAAAVGETARSVNGSLTGLQRRDLISRVPAEVENEDGSHKAIKLIKITEKGKTFDPDAPDEKEA